MYTCNIYKDIYVYLPADCLKFLAEDMRFFEKEDNKSSEIKALADARLIELDSPSSYRRFLPARQLLTQPLCMFLFMLIVLIIQYFFLEKKQQKSYMTHL